MKRTNPKRMEKRLQLNTQTVRQLEVVDDKKLEEVGGGVYEPKSITIN